jgi:hypothetical protein
MAAGSLGRMPCDPTATTPDVTTESPKATAAATIAAHAKARTNTTNALISSPIAHVWFARFVLQPDFGTAAATLQRPVHICPLMFLNRRALPTPVCISYNR